MMVNNKTFVSVLVGILLVSSLIFAAHIVLNVAGGSTFYVVEDTFTLYNITVNVTDIGSVSNVSQVNVSLPSGFTFLSGSNGSNTLSDPFSNTSSVLTWTNASSLINGTPIAPLSWFSFNLSASTPGYFNITVITVNATTVRYSNISVVVNDTTAPSSISYASPGITVGSYNSTRTLYFNISVADNYALNTLRIFLFTSAHAITNNSNVTLSGTSSSYLINYTGLSDGVYLINATLNDTSGNTNSTGPTLRVVLDSTAPTVAVSLSSAHQTSLDLNYSYTDATSGVIDTSYCSINRGDAVISGTAINEIGLSCGTTYEYVVSCTDRSGNTGSDTESFTTSACSTGGGSSGGGGSSSTSTWSNTYVVTDTQFSSGYSRELAAKNRMQFKLDSKVHHIGVKSISGNSATIEVASTPQSATMNAGDEKQFDIDGDGYYDISVKLISVSNNKANIEVKKLVDVVPVSEEPVSGESAGEGTTDEVPAESGQDKSYTTWVILIIVILIIIILAVYLMKMKKNKRYMMYGF